MNDDEIRHFTKDQSFSDIIFITKRFKEIWGDNNLTHKILFDNNKNPEDNSRVFSNKIIHYIQSNLNYRLGTKHTFMLDQSSLLKDYGFNINEMQYYNCHLDSMFLDIMKDISIFFADSYHVRFSLELEFKYDTKVIVIHFENRVTNDVKIC
jgi:hypothetical protein